MSAQAFQRFVDLITFDRETHEMAQAISAGEVILQSLEAQKKEHTAQLSTLQEQLHTQRKLVDQLELTMKTLEQSEREKKLALDSASMPSVYRALKAELEQVNNDQLSCEQDLMAAWNSVESLRKTVSALEASVHGQVVALDAAVDQEHVKMAEIDEKLEHREQERAEKLAGIPEEWLEEYSRMRSRVPNPVVAVNGSSCSACFALITGQDMARLRNKALLSCKGCYRLLYIKD